MAVSSSSSSLWRTLIESDRVDPHHEFSRANLPYGVAKRAGEVFLCTRLRDVVVRLDGLRGLAEPINNGDNTNNNKWNGLMTLSKARRARFRESLQEQLFDERKSPLFDDANFQKLVFPVWECQMQLPCQIGDYSDFYCSRQHAYNVGVMFRGKDNALQPNWTHLPVGYHGRSSSVVQSPCKVVHPCGQLDEGKTFGPSKRLDFELEVGVFVGGEENPMGVPLTVQQARDRIFGYVLLNDWSARDVQTWEYVPLGPFCAKNFCTTISPWIVPAEALEPYLATPSFADKQDPQPLPYLQDDKYLLPDVELFVSIRPHGQTKETLISQSNFRNLYWTPAQMIAHHSSTGCNMRAGDLIGTGTISGPEPNSFGSMLELSWGGKNPITLSTGETRTFLQDGDTVTMSGRVKGAGIGFGECSGSILPVHMQGSAKL